MWEIPRTIVNQMFGHAQRSFPEECVGILSGQEGEISQCHTLTNALGETRRFLADPEEQIKLFKDLRTQGRELMAIYHSHPEGAAEPSQADLLQAYYEEALYLIIALGTDGRLDMQGYQIKAGKAEAVELSIRD
uniref:Putative Mov34/MPN/PAD-1 family protein n=1 Tax=Magnetococcus massalia (strain MO-1) TaxID=451514 RepID=A0A1S7LLJ1_MAGMO|nr:putative Mov34/MPN/PAD-1 family protein [Candidatus Magnetococcus massalia]